MGKEKKINTSNEEKIIKAVQVMVKIAIRIIERKKVPLNTPLPATQENSRPDGLSAKKSKSKNR